jgi:hypothetical protein
LRQAVEAYGVLVLKLERSTGALLHSEVVLYQAYAEALLLLDEQLVVDLVVEGVEQGTGGRRETALVPGSPLGLTGGNALGQVLKLRHRKR